MTGDVLFLRVLIILIVMLVVPVLGSAQAPKVNDPRAIPKLDPRPVKPDPVAKPNLRIDGLWVYPDIYRDNETQDIMSRDVAPGYTRDGEYHTPHQLCIKVVNAGLGSSGPFTVSVNHGLRKYSVRSLAPGRMTKNCVPTEGGSLQRPDLYSYASLVIIDPDNKVAETSESDNEGRLTINAWSRPDLTRVCQGGRIEWIPNPNPVEKPEYRCTFRDQTVWRCFEAALRPGEEKTLRCTFHSNLLSPLRPTSDHP